MPRSRHPRRHSPAAPSRPPSHRSKWTCGTWTSTSPRRSISRFAIFAAASSPPARGRRRISTTRRSYSVAVDTGEVAVDLASLNAIVTRALQRGPLERPPPADLHRRHGTASAEGRVEKRHQRAVRHEGQRRRHARWPDPHSLGVDQRVRRTGQSAAQGAPPADRRPDSGRSGSRHPRRRQRSAARRVAAPAAAGVPRQAHIGARRARRAGSGLRLGHSTAHLASRRPRRITSTGAAASSHSES